MLNQDVGVFRVAAAAVVTNSQNQVLLTQRSLRRDHHPGTWEILSGRLNQGESFEQALQREAWEELRIKIEPIVVLDTFHFFRGQEQVEHVGVAYLAKYTQGEVQVDGVEEVAFRWSSFEEALSLVQDASIKNNLTKANEYLIKEASLRPKS